MEVTATSIKDLRERTGAGMADCKKALTESRRRHGQGDRLPAREGSREGGEEGRPRGDRGRWWCRTSTPAAASACSSRSTARPTSSRATRTSSRSRKDVAMQIAAMGPQFVRKEEVPADAVEKEKARPHREGEGRPEDGGQARARCSPRSPRVRSRSGSKEICLLDQPFVKNPDKTIEQLQQELDREDRREHQDPPLRALRARRGSREEEERLRRRSRRASRHVLSTLHV